MIPFVEDGDPKIPLNDEGDPTGVEKEPTGLVKQDRVRRVPYKKNRVGHFVGYKSLSGRKRILVTLTGVVPSGESHPEEEEGDEEMSERRENRRLLQRINLKKMSSTECFVTLPPIFSTKIKETGSVNEELF